MKNLSSTDIYNSIVIPIVISMLWSGALNAIASPDPVHDSVKMPFLSSYRPGDHRTQ